MCFNKIIKKAKEYLKEYDYIKNVYIVEPYYLMICNYRYIEFLVETDYVEIDNNLILHLGGDLSEILGVDVIVNSFTKAMNAKNQCPQYYGILRIYSRDDKTKTYLDKAFGHFNTANYLYNSKEYKENKIDGESIGLSLKTSVECAIRYVLNIYGIQLEPRPYSLEYLISSVDKSKIDLLINEYLLSIIKMLDSFEDINYMCVYPKVGDEELENALRYVKHYLNDLAEIA